MLDQHILMLQRIVALGFKVIIVHPQPEVRVNLDGFEFGHIYRRSD
jgi:hypothetical protein